MTPTLVLLLAAVPAEPTTSVRWRAPAGCPSADVVQQRIETLLARSLVPGELALDAEVRADGDAFAVELTIVGGGTTDRRTLLAADCETLADAAALVGAVLLDPVRTTTELEVATTVAPALDVPDPIVGDPTGSRPRSPPRIRRGDKPRTPDEIEPEPPRPRTRGDRELAAWTRIRAGVQYGAVPGVTGGFELAVGLGVRRVRGELAGSYWIPRRVDDARAPMRVHLGTVAPRVCATVPQRRIDVVACAGGELGIMRADLDAGVRQPLWLAIVAEAGIRAPLTGRLSLWVTAVAQVPVVSPRFQLEDPNDAARTASVYRPSPAGVRGLVGLEVRLRGLDKRQ